MSTQLQASPMRGQTQSILSQGLNRPKWQRRLQEVFLVRDASSSMSGQKAADASAASLDLLAELADPVNKDGFRAALIDFASAATVVRSLGPATAMHAEGGAPLIATGGSTNITAGLESTLAILKGSREGDDARQRLRPVVICFTDGGHNVGPGPQGVASQLKSIADVVAVAFGEDADEKLLRELASSPEHFYRCSNGRDLRKFLAAVGATMSQSLAAGQNATQALAAIPAIP